MTEARLPQPAGRLPSRAVTLPARLGSRSSGSIAAFYSVRPQDYPVRSQPPEDTKKHPKTWPAGWLAGRGTNSKHTTARRNHPRPVSVLVASTPPPCKGEFASGHALSPPAACAPPSANPTLQRDGAHPLTVGPRCTLDTS